MKKGKRPCSQERVWKGGRSCTEEADLEAFRRYTAPSFVFEIMGAQPAAGEWRGVNAMKRHFTAFKDNFTTEFQVTATEI
jgi:hypothetical protein